MTQLKLAQDLCDFIEQSPTPFHAVRQMARRLDEAGFTRLEDNASWSLKANSRYYITRNESSIIALQLGADALPEHGIRMIGAHTDSPCLKVKPNPEINTQGYLQLGVEVYGGALLNPWFDRDLSIAGRISYLDDNNALCSALVDFKVPLAYIPSLAIHLDREANNTRSINAQNDLPPLILQVDKKEKSDFRQMLRTQLGKEQPKINVANVLDYELCLYDTNKPALVGLEQDFVAAARLDNLLSCFCGLESLINSKGDSSRLLVCTDHEEVGSASTSGAAGPFLESLLLRLGESLLDNSQDAYQRMLSHSVLLSVDNAHAIHPNFASKHDGKHGPIMNAGPVIKYNANQRYATNSNTGALFQKVCRDAQVPCQSFVVRSDMACGSTIGPIIASKLGVPTLDLGVPTLGMHSIREMAGSKDIEYLSTALEHFYSMS